MKYRPNRVCTPGQALVAPAKFRSASPQRSGEAREQALQALRRERQRLLSRHKP